MCFNANLMLSKQNCYNVYRDSYRGREKSEKFTKKLCLLRLDRKETSVLSYLQREEASSEVREIDFSLKFIQNKAPLG